MSSSQAVKDWRERTKDRVVRAMGGECQICHYHRCFKALELHHLDPSVKEYSLGAMRASPRSWDRIVIELRKCVLLCSNCHKELHAGETELPSGYARFDESYLTYEPEHRKMNACPECGTMKSIYSTTCSRGCSAKRSWRVDWTKIDVVELVKRHGGNYTRAGMELGLSDSAVRKRFLKVTHRSVA